jgi:Fur family transcriptional regulator, ferric uptake regulator
MNTITAEKWISALHGSGCRVTGARSAVVETVAGADHALTPLDVYQSARECYPALGLVTVYRTLEKLEELGLIQRVHQERGCQAFIPAGTGHQHLLLCQGCGRITYFEGDNLDPLFADIASRTGYRIHEHWLQLFGTCRKCQQPN